MFNLLRISTLREEQAVGFNEYHVSALDEK